MNTRRPVTFLSLSQYAEMIGLDPIQFFGGVAASYRNRQRCDDVWFEYGWQDGGKIARLELLNAISSAERDIIKQLGYYPYPEWVEDERLAYPKFGQPGRYGVYGRDVNWQWKSIHTNKKYVQFGGQRATSQLTADRLADIDTTGDGFDDTAVFEINDYENELCEIEAYFKEYDTADSENTRTDPASKGADRAWRIRPINTEFDSATNTATVYIKVWLFFKPQLQQQMNMGANDNPYIDAESATSYVDTVEFYRVYNDPSTMVQFLWVNELSCSSAACAYATQNGCMRVTDSRRGEVSISPSTYVTATNAYTQGYFSQSVEPQKVRLWYKAGITDEFDDCNNEIPYDLAYTIAMLASARLTKDICSCDNIRTLINDWRQNATLFRREGSYSFSQADLSNPFGSKVGEVLAYKRLNNIGNRVGRAIRL